MPVKKKTNSKKKLRRDQPKPRRDLAGAAESPSAWSAPNRWERQRSDQAVPSLKFSPYAWSKLLYLRDLGETEVGGFGISSPDDLFVIEDVVLVQQSCTFATVEFDDESVADFFDEQVDQGRKPEEFSRCWIHTHPGDSAEPSGTDEATFARVFGGSSWAVMMILARGGQAYARLRFGCGPGAELLVPVEIAWDVPFEGCDQAAWKQEYKRCVKDAQSAPAAHFHQFGRDEFSFWDNGYEWLDERGCPALAGDEIEQERNTIHDEANACDLL